MDSEWDMQTRPFELLGHQDDEARSEDPAPSSCRGWSLLVALRIRESKQIEREGEA